MRYYVLAMLGMLLTVNAAIAATPELLPASGSDAIAQMESDLYHASSELDGVAIYGDGFKRNQKGGGSTFTAGVEATYLKANFRNYVAGFFEDADDSLLGGAPFGHDWEAAPRIWIGWEHCCGKGIRARYWEYDAESRMTDLSVNGSDFVASSFISDLDAYTVDLEYTCRACHGRSSYLYMLGVRHNAIDHRFAGQSIIYDDDTSVDFGLQTIGRRFDGTGVTYGMEVRRPVTNNIALLWNMRGSYTWGRNKATLVDLDVDVDVGGNADSDADIVLDSSSDTVFVGELQAGIEWSRCFNSCGGGRAFARTMFEGQWWDLNRRGLRDDDNNLAVADALGNGRGAQFYGLTFTVGFER